MLDDLPFLQAHPFHDRRDPVAAEEPHQVIFQRQEKEGRTGVPLPPRTAAKLPVDAPRFMALRPDDVQTTGVPHAGSELDVGSAARHVRRDRYHARESRMGDDLRLSLVLLGVEDVVGDVLPLQHPAYRL